MFVSLTFCSLNVPQSERLLETKGQGYLQMKVLMVDHKRDRFDLYFYYTVSTVMTPIKSTVKLDGCCLTEANVEKLLVENVFFSSMVVLFFGLE